MLSPNYQIFPANFRLVNMTAGGISFILLLNNLLEDTWKRQAAYGVVILFVLTAAMMAINLPLTLYRLFT
jgi:hypothetical protein